MRLAFLGTGAAFSHERYNGAVAVDGRILLDAGAPLLPHLRRVGIDPGAIEVVFLTHFHGDHVLGLATFLLQRVFEAPGRLTLVAPEGGAEVVERLMELAWGPDWDTFKGRLELEHVVAGESGEAAGVGFQAVRLDHGSRGGTGYRLHLGGRVLAYAGDSEATPPLDSLVAGTDVAIVEATAPGEVVSHTSWEAAAALAARHPGTRFFFNHVYAGDPPGAAHDLEIIEV